MCLAIVILLLQYFLILFSVSCERKEYECGEHGRFEYCIDEIPGCVIGCHCHPGYYFDTDTKICEPNLKLIEHLRRSNIAESPYSIQGTISTTSKIHGEVESISKDADGLGDWLYNQFFKTIENQVVNATSGKNIITRRSNLAVAGDKKVKRKKTDKNKRGGKQKRRKTNKKKTRLRITENASLFDITASGSHSRSTSSEASDSSFELNSSDEEHGHKKIVMIKKKPRRPLPNFIFLPNMETPFYPPIGLPPPPIAAPMYPMVPVPPIIPFFSDESDEKTTTAITTTSTTTTTKTSTTPKETVPTETTTDEDEAASEIVDALRHPTKKRSKHEGSNDPSFNMSPNRQKFLQYIKQKMKNKSPKTFKPPAEIVQDTKLTNFESQYPDNIYHGTSYLNNNNVKENQEEAASANVDFKYMTELIHRVDINKSNDLPPIEYNPLDSLEVYQPPKYHISDYIVPPNIPDTRRSIRTRHQQPDESYYTHLGRQIASVIRNIDTQNKEVNIKLEASRDIPKNDVYFNVNSPRSYWERSVRSPLTFLKTNKKRFEYLKRSNEMLFDIENKVEIIASTVPSLTLREIENIVKRMEKDKGDAKFKTQKRKSIKNPKTSSNLNLKLWPNDLNTRDLERTSMQVLPQNIFKQTVERPKIGYDHNQINSPKNVESLKVIQINRLAVRHKIQPNNKSLHIQPSQKETNVKPYISSNPRNYNKLPPYRRLNEKPAQSILLDQTSRPLIEHKINPLVLNGRRYFEPNNYFGNPNENFLNIKPMANFARIQPSYFQNEINLIDY